MPTKKELEQLGLTQLDVLCKRVADKPSQYSDATAEQARKLHLEWHSLSAGTPPPSAKLLAETQTKKRVLKKRIVEFLARTL